MREEPPSPTEQAPPESVVDLAGRTHDAPPHDAPGTAEPPAASPPDDLVPELRLHADLVIAEVEGRKIGEGKLVPMPHGWGVRVYVHPAYRRRGLGGRLLREVTEVATDRGIAELDVRLDAQDLVGLKLVLASGLCGSLSCDNGETRTRLVLHRRAAAG